MQKTLRNIFNLFQKVNLNILPKHFYCNIPDFGFLNNQENWKHAMSMEGVSGTDIQQQVNFVKQCVDSLEDKSVLENQNIFDDAIKQQKEFGYGVVEADFLYSFINHFKPKKVIQIGCGVSTSVMLRASEAADHPINITCIEPYPSDYLKQLHSEGKIQLISELAQNVAIDELIHLEDGDLLFVDSTHTVKVGSEVNRIILEVLPHLQKGVFVHFHDIYFPYDYQRNINETIFFWNESTLLHAFLINNSKFTIKASESMSHYEAKDFLRDTFPNYNPQSEEDGIPINRSKEYHFPSATFLQVV